MLFVREFSPLQVTSFRFTRFTWRKDYMMVETLLSCLVWVVLGVLLLFSTIRLFFPLFNDDLGTMPTQRPCSWKKNSRTKSMAAQSVL